MYLPLHHLRVCATATALVALLLCGCTGREPVPAAEFLPATQGPVEACAMTLGAQAAPEQVAWALLCVLRQRVEAPRSDSRARSQALKLQCALANLEYFRATLGTPGGRRQDQADELTFELIDGWMPIVKYYVHYFDDTFEQARARMTTSKETVTTAGTPAPFPTVSVDYALPSASFGGPPGLAIGVTIHIGLAKTRDGYWRAHWVGYGSSPDLAHATTEAP